MIPKVIHYCWFGGNPKGEKELRCIESWKKYCPDYKIIEWNEQNYDINAHYFLKEAYHRKKWAFVSDYARLDIIYKHGGIYLDTDVEIIKPIDSLLDFEMFAGFEDEKNVNFGLGYGAEKNHPYLKEMMKVYDKIKFPENDKDLSKIACPIIQTAVLKHHGLLQNGKNQKISKCSVFSTEYFSPKNFQTGELNITEKTYSIHHFNMSWFTPEAAALNEKKWELIKKYKSNNLLVKSILFFERLKMFPRKLKRQYRQGGMRGIVRYTSMIVENSISMIIKKKS